jgi:outer membrane lipoprotein-sorting protein
VLISLDFTHFLVTPGRPAHPTIVVSSRGFSGRFTRGMRMRVGFMRGVQAALALGIILSAACGLLPAASHRGREALSLNEIQRQMDDAARDFHSLSADVERTKVTVVVNDRSTETGTIRVRGDKMLLQLNAPEARTVLRNGDNLYLYNPGLQRVEEYNLGKNRGLVDQFLLLGFGTSGRDLRKAYLVTLEGEQTIDDRKTVELELTPKSDAVRKQVSKVDLWLDLSSMLPVQQEFYETGSGDYSIVKYSHVVKNPNISDSIFRPHWPKGTEKLKPQA